MLAERRTPIDFGCSEIINWAYSQAQLAIFQTIAFVSGESRREHAPRRQIRQAHPLGLSSRNLLVRFAFKALLHLELAACWPQDPR